MSSCLMLPIACRTFKLAPLIALIDPALTLSLLRTETFPMRNLRNSSASCSCFSLSSIIFSAATRIAFETRCSMPAILSRTSGSLSCFRRTAASSNSGILSQAGASWCRNDARRRRTLESGSYASLNTSRANRFRNVRVLKYCRAVCDASRKATLKKCTPVCAQRVRIIPSISSLPTMSGMYRRQLTAAETAARRTSKGPSSVRPIKRGTIVLRSAAYGKSCAHCSRLYAREHWVLQPSRPSSSMFLYNGTRRSSDGLISTTLCRVTWNCSRTLSRTTSLGSSRRLKNIAYSVSTVSTVARSFVSSWKPAATYHLVSGSVLLARIRTIFTTSGRNSFRRHSAQAGRL
mmetsp:Transcript_760/g.2458  ORF Transcript_760/g.2458 Transcript_760/m.2458 type:complete len:347 (-) Transcript_760:1412-2452(-)